MRSKGLNLCRVVLTMPSETRQTKAVHLGFECCTNGWPAMNCLYYKPDRCSTGELTIFECGHFRDGQCTCGKARSAAQRRAEALLKDFLA